MADIPKISDELLLRAFARPSLGQTIQAGTEGFKTGTDIGISLAEQKAKRKKEEQDLLNQIAQLKLQRDQETRVKAGQKASLITPEMAPKVKEPVTPEVYKTLFPESSVKENIAPTGYQFKADGSLEPIPGSEAARKREKEDEAAKQLYTQHLTKAKLAKSFVDQTIPKVTYGTAGFGAYRAIFPGKARNLQSDIQEIKSRIGLDALIAAKATSPTGASGFGQLSDKEMELLQAQVANLDQVQTPEQLREKLAVVSQHYNNVLELIEGRNPYNDKNPAPDVSAVPTPAVPSTVATFKKTKAGNSYKVK